MRDNRVRTASAVDEDRIYDVLMALHRDNPVDVYDPARVREQIAKGASQAKEWGGLIGVVDSPSGDEIIASIGIFPNRPWFSDTWNLYELWLFVHPAYRHNGLETDLFAFAIDYRRRMSQALGKEIRLFSSVTSLKRLAAKIRLWSRFGQMIGATFVLKG